jgi:hypothetical protein
LIEEHSKEFLDTMPAKAFVKYLLQKHNHEITNLLNQEFENNLKIFNVLLEFIKKKFVFETQEIEG